MFYSYMNYFFLVSGLFIAGVFIGVSVRWKTAIER